MTTRRAFLESLGLALGVGVVARAAPPVSRRVRVEADGASTITAKLPEAFRTPDGSRITGLTPFNGELFVTTTTGIYVFDDGALDGPIYGKRRSAKITRRIATTSGRVRTP